MLPCQPRLRLRRGHASSTPVQTSSLVQVLPTSDGTVENRSRYGYAPCGGGGHRWGGQLSHLRGRESHARRPSRRGAPQERSRTSSTLRGCLVSAMLQFTCLA